jgi:NADH-quinone oxidoreductase subunit N
MIHRPHVDWFALAPVNALLAAVAIALLAAVLVPRHARRTTGAVVCALGYATAFGFAIALYVRSAHASGVVADALRRDRFAELTQMIVAGAGLLATGVSLRERMRDDHVAEYYALLAAAGSGMCFFVGANNLLTLFLGLEWLSIALYILCAIDRDLVGGLEAGLKYLIIGSFGSAVLLFGSALVYGETGHLDFAGIDSVHHSSLAVFGLAMLIVGLGFKASAAPFHQWTPDVYEGAPTPVTAFMAAATKTVALVVMLRVLTVGFEQDRRLWTVAVAVIAVASLTVGNFAALVQRNVKRMLAYSSISHAGFMLIAVAANNALGARALLYYLIPYAAMSIGSFAVVAARERELGVPVTFENLAGFGWERPLLGVSMWTFMFGFAGFPLTGGFVGKFYVFSAAYRHGWTWLVIVGVLATLVSLYYYLGIVRAMFMRRPEELQLAPVGGSPPREDVLQTVVAVQPLIDLAKHASHALPF